MSTQRNVGQDRQATVDRVADRSRSKGDGVRNWLGHTKGAACIDEKLLDGATTEELLECRGAVEEHVRHLREEHGLEVTEGHIRRFRPTEKPSGGGDE